jgi:hypothetical protein
MSPRALRITSLPISIDKTELHKFLEALECPDSIGLPNGSNVVDLTLVPEVQSQVATVVFRKEPRILEGIVPRKTATLELESGGSRHRLVVDCDFFGMTALHSMDNASVEYATVLPPRYVIQMF